MINMEQEIEIEWNNANRKWFISKGYEFTNWGDKFKVKISDLRPKSGYMIKYICDYCGNEINQSYNTYSLGHNKYPKDACRYCASKKQIEMRHDQLTNTMKEKVLNKAKEKNYAVIFDWNNYINQSTRIKYICKKHGEHEMSVGNFVKGYGCPDCGNESVSKKMKLSLEEVIDIIESIDGNKLLNPEAYIRNSERNLLVKCSCGNIFKTSISKYPKKHKCSKCARSLSIGEEKIKNFLDNNNIPYTRQYKYEDCVDKKPLPFDFHINNDSINIEFDGKQHFEPIYGQESLEYIQKHDAIKTKYCTDNNIKLIRINYLQYDDIDKILTKELLIT